MRIIMDQWKSPIHQVIPAHMAPTSWSKHLLSLLATLSRSMQSTDEAVSLLKRSIHQRPRRSRQGCTLMPSDVERVLRSLPSVTLARRRLPLDRDPRARRCRVYRSGSLSGISTAGSTDSASDVALEETNPLLVESDQVPEGTMATGTKHSADCWCSPACFPLRLVFRTSQPPIPSDLVVGLLMWAKSMAWSNICNAHLGRLGELRFGASVKSWSRDEIVSQLEIVLSEVRLSKGDLILPPSEDNFHWQNLTSAEDQSQLPSPHVPLPYWALPLHDGEVFMSLQPHSVPI